MGDWLLWFWRGIVASTAKALLVLRGNPVRDARVINVMALETLDRLQNEVERLSGKLTELESKSTLQEEEIVSLKVALDECQRKHAKKDQEFELIKSMLGGESTETWKGLFDGKSRSRKIDQ